MTAARIAAAQTANLLAHTADIIEPHLTGTYRRRDRAEGAAEDLHQAGLLVGGTAETSRPVREQAASLLQCRHPWTVAEKMADDLAAAGLLTEPTNGVAP